MATETKKSESKGVWIVRFYGNQDLIKEKISEGVYFPTKEQALQAAVYDMYKPVMRLSEIIHLGEDIKDALKKCETLEEHLAVVNKYWNCRFGQVREKHLRLLIDTVRDNYDNLEHFKFVFNLKGEVAEFYNEDNEMYLDNFNCEFPFHTMLLNKKKLKTVIMDSFLMDDADATWGDSSLMYKDILSAKNMPELKKLHLTTSPPYLAEATEVEDLTVDAKLYINYSHYPKVRYLTIYGPYSTISYILSHALAKIPAHIEQLTLRNALVGLETDNNHYCTTVKQLRIDNGRYEPCYINDNTIKTFRRVQKLIIKNLSKDDIARASFWKLLRDKMLDLKEIVAENFTAATNADLTQRLLAVQTGALNRYEEIVNVSNLK